MMFGFTKKVVGKAIIEMEITENDISSIIIGAFEGGCNYWMGLDNSKPEWTDKTSGEPLSIWATKLLIDGKTIHLYDVEDNEEKWELTLEKLISGVKYYASKHRDGMNKDNWDAESVDCIVQYGLFGKLVYG